MYKAAVLVLATLFIFGGCMGIVAAKTYVSFETLVTATTTGDNPSLNISTTTMNEIVDDQIFDRPPAHYRPKRGPHGGGKW